MIRQVLLGMILATAPFAQAAKSRTLVLIESEQLRVPGWAGEVYLLSQVRRPGGRTGYLLSHAVGGRVLGQKVLSANLYQELRAGYARLPRGTQLGCHVTLLRTEFKSGRTREILACLDDGAAARDFALLTTRIKELFALGPARLPASLTKPRR